MAGLLVSVAILAVLVLGYGYIVLAEPGRSNRAATLVDPPSSPSPSPTVGRPVTGSTAPVAGSRPARIAIDSIGVSSPLESVSLDQAGGLQPPNRYDEAGWYAKGIQPGSVGAALIIGFDTAPTGSAVFARLRDLRVGDLITVQRQDGTNLHFEVDDVHAYPTANLPSSATHGTTTVPELRLVTCDDDNAGQSHSYLQNLVVSAHLS